MVSVVRTAWVFQTEYRKAVGEHVPSMLVVVTYCMEREVDDCSFGQAAGKTKDAAVTINWT